MVVYSEACCTRVASRTFWPKCFMNDGCDGDTVSRRICKLSFNGGRSITRRLIDPKSSDMSFLFCNVIFFV